MGAWLTVGVHPGGGHLFVRQTGDDQAELPRQAARTADQCAVNVVQVLTYVAQHGVEP